MDVCFPGTVIRRQGKSAEEFLSGLFFATNGIMLSQVREITVLDTPTIQNWVNRGWVQRPVEKRYFEAHLGRIMLINMLRNVTKLENVQNIMTYINGSVNCREDDIISEAKLYIYVCDILDTIGFDTILSEPGLDEKISERIGDYKEPFPGAAQKLRNGIKIIITYYAAALIKTRADKRAGELGIISRDAPPQDDGTARTGDGNDDNI